jgi:carboxypeptidase Taq
MQAHLTELKTRLLEASDIRSAAAVMSWDQSTYMPEKGAPARGRQMATLQRIAHEKSIAPEVGRLIDKLERDMNLPADSDEAALVRQARRNYDRFTRIPPHRYAALFQHMSASYMAWAKARPANDFAAMLPYLEKTLDFSRELANYFPGCDHIADPLIDFTDYGMNAASVRAVFASLRAELVPLVQAITAQPPADDSCLKQFFPKKDQEAFGVELIIAYGFDFQRGRQDHTLHPYMTRFASGDVRITTRFSDHDFGDGLFSTLHEAGHAMYELGVNPAFEGTPLGGGTSAGVHESQSRLWENIVGRSRAFWEWAYPRAQAVFPAQLGSVPLDTFHRAINKVQRSLIRVDADEVTYNLHVMMRFEFELQLLEGSLALRDLPEAWRARMQADLGVNVPDDKDGVLQDVHWYDGVIGGAFQGYTLGNIMSAQFYAAALAAHPEIPDEMRAGRFAALHNWMRENIYQHGAKYTASELLERTTGGGLDTQPYVNYLRTKYGELYDL